MMTRDRIALLEAKSWKGVAPGASHWMGNIWFAQKNHRIERTLTTMAAERFNQSLAPHHRLMPYTGGDRCDRFETSELLLEYVKRHWRKWYPDARVLVLGHYAVADPQLIVDGLSAWQRKALNRIFKQCESLGWYDGGNDRLVGELGATWRGALDVFIQLELRLAGAEPATRGE